MDIAKNENGEVVSIENASRTDTYYCLACGEKLKAKIGKIKQYFSHKIHSPDCELKITQMKLLKTNKNEKEDIIPQDSDVLNYLYDNILNNEIEKVDGFTQEQLDVIHSTDKKIKIVAKAGSGKSYTCREYMKLRPEKQKLFIVFNKKLAEECSVDFKDIPNMEVRTTYSLAYKFIGYRYRDKLTNNDLSIFDYAKAMEMFAKNFDDFYLVDTVSVEFNRYLASNFYSIDEFCKQEELGDKISSYMTIVFNNWKDVGNKHKVSHSFYLKLWQLSKPNLSSYCDILCIDEAQDISECMADIIENCKVDTVIATGDGYQEIYNFSNPVSGFKNITGKEYPLTNCFRIGNTLAKLNAEIFNKYEGVEFVFSGYNPSQKIVRSVNRDKQHVRIFRSNYAIIMDMLDEIENGKTFYIEGKNGKLNYNYDLIQRVFDLKFNDIIHYTLKAYRDYETLRYKANDKNTPMELKSAVRIVEVLGQSTMIKLNKLNESMTNREMANIIYSTVHQCKGLTISIPVIVGNDFIDLSQEINWQDVKYEIFILYVALTRSKNEVELPSFMLNWFENNCKDFKNKYRKRR
jgi:F-box protein, helicase, 18